MSLSRRGARASAGAPGSPGRYRKPSTRLAEAGTLAVAALA
jgi:hypothetical protein